MKAMKATKTPGMKVVKATPKKKAMVAMKAMKAPAMKIMKAMKAPAHDPVLQMRWGWYCTSRNCADKTEWYKPIQCPTCMRWTKRVDGFHVWEQMQASSDDESAE